MKNQLKIPFLGLFSNSTTSDFWLHKQRYFKFDGFI